MGQQMRTEADLTDPLHFGALGFFPAKLRISIVYYSPSLINVCIRIISEISIQKSEWSKEKQKYYKINSYFEGQPNEGSTDLAYTEPPTLVHLETNSMKFVTTRNVVIGPVREPS